MKGEFLTAMLLVCATLATVAGAAEDENLTLPQAQSIAKAERAKVAQHTSALADAKSKQSMANLTPQERKYLNATVEAQSRYLKEATTRAIQAEGAVARLQSEAAALANAARQDNAGQPGPQIGEQAQGQVAANEPKKTAAPRALHVVTFKDGKTLDILRYVEVDDQYSLQTVDKKFKTVPKDTVQSIEDKKPAQ